MCIHTTPHGYTHRSDVYTHHSDVYIHAVGGYTHGCAHSLAPSRPPHLAPPHLTPPHLTSLHPALEINPAQLLRLLASVHATGVGIEASGIVPGHCQCISPISQYKVLTIRFTIHSVLYSHMLRTHTSMLCIEGYCMCIALAAAVQARPNTLHNSHQCRSY
jgi:hypothetical protein